MKSTRPPLDDVFLMDLLAGSNELVSVNLAGISGGNGSSFGAVVSYEGRFVVFASQASDLVANDRNRAADIFVRDRFNRITHCLSQSYRGTGTANRGSSQHIVSADGRTVAFQSFASDLVPGDYNDTRDVFVATLGGPDSDGDGMEDDWEMAYFDTLDRDGSGDFDNDGASDLAEFRAGTNPANNSSVLRALSLTIVRVPPDAPEQYSVLVWTATPGKTYRVEHKADIADPWNVVSPDIVSGMSTVSFAHVVSNPPARGFYRVVLVEEGRGLSSAPP